MTALDSIRALREMVERATQGPWRESLAMYASHDRRGEANAALICAMHEALPALLAVAEAADALLTDVCDSCCVLPGSEPPRLAEGEEPICGKPARYGLLTAWTCEEHRREKDRNEIGGPARKQAFAALSALARAKGGGK